MEMTSAESFEDSHRRMGLRSRISNALMAITLLEVGSTSSNLPKYIAGGLNLCQEFLGGLKLIREHLPAFYWQDYPTKVLVDILTNRLRKPVDTTRLEVLKKGLESAKQVFEIISRQGGLSEERARETEKMLLELDGEIVSTYGEEDSLYHRYPLLR